MQTIQGKAYFTVTIASGATASESFPTYGYRSLAVGTPAAITGTALAVHGSNRKSGTYLALQDAGGAVSESASANQIILFGEVLVTPFAKVVSNGAEGAARTLTIYLMS